MGLGMVELSLDGRKGKVAGEIVRPPATDRGKLRSAAWIAANICDGHFGKRWVIDRMGPVIGKKPGREWLFYEADAKQWWDAYLEKTGGDQ